MEGSTGSADGRDPDAGADPLRVWAGDLSGLDVTARSARLALSPIVRAHLDHRLDPERRALRYGSLLTHYRLTDLADAEVALLPVELGSASPDDVRTRLAAAERHGLRTLVFANGDLEPLLPSASMILLHAGPTRGAQPSATSIAVPYFFTDRWSGADRADPEPPTVAFCGQGTSGRGAALGLTARRAVLAARQRRSPDVVTPPIRGHIGLRAQALRALQNDPRIDDRFVIRDRYRAGAVTDDERARTQREFDDNLRSATYALCVRGTGNFSARFYEALSFGRIPLFVDTGCVLPFEDEIDWRRRCVWIDESEVDDIADILVADHGVNRHAPDRTEASLRRLWEERLTQHGFFAHIVTTLRHLCR